MQQEKSLPNGGDFFITCAANFTCNANFTAQATSLAQQTSLFVKFLRSEVRSE
jgi:hypothetical protein